MPRVRRASNLERLVNRRPQSNRLRVLLQQVLNVGRLGNPGDLFQFRFQRVQHKVACCRPALRHITPVATLIGTLTQSEVESCRIP